MAPARIRVPGCGGPAELLPTDWLEARFLPEPRRSDPDISANCQCGGSNNVEVLPGGRFTSLDGFLEGLRDVVGVHVMHQLGATSGNLQRPAGGARAPPT